MEYNHKVQLNHSTLQYENFEKDNKTKCHVDYGSEATIMENTDCSLIFTPKQKRLM